MSNEGQVLTDLSGKPFVFFRRGNDETAWWTSYYKVAEKFRPDETIRRANVKIRNPLVIDFKCNGYYHPKKDVVAVYPVPARKDYEKFSLQHSDSINSWSEDFVRFLKANRQYDAVILKNVYEGFCPDFPVYDLITIDPGILLNVRQVSAGLNAYNWCAKKRLDLSKYLPEDERYGIVEAIPFDGYSLLQKLDPVRANCTIYLHVDARKPGSYVQINGMDGRTYYLNTADRYGKSITSVNTGISKFSIGDGLELSLSTSSLRTALGYRIAICDP